MTEKLVGRGQYTIVHMHDGKSMRVVLHSNMPYIQFFSRQHNTYTPNYIDTNIVITPELYFSGSEEDQIKCTKNITWSINGKKPSEFGGKVSRKFPHELTISKNMENSSQMKIDFSCTVIDPDTHLETKISSDLCFTKQQDAEITPMLIIDYPGGKIFKNDVYKTLSGVAKMIVGTHDMSELAEYTWYQLVEKRYIKVVDSLGIYGQGTNTITVAHDYITDNQHFKCVVSFQGVVYTEYVTFSKQTDSYIIKIENKNGDKMRNGEGVVSCEAHLYLGAEMIPDAKAETMFLFKWSKYNRLTGERNNEWRSPVGRKIELNKEDIDKLSTFMCEATHKNSNSFPYQIPFVLS